MSRTVPDCTVAYRRRRGSTLSRWLALVALMLVVIFGGGVLAGELVSRWLGF